MLKADTLQISPEILSLIARIGEFIEGIRLSDREVEQQLSKLKIKFFVTATCRK